MSAFYPTSVLNARVFAMRACDITSRSTDRPVPEQSPGRGDL